MLFGWLSDRYGRARALRWSILAFSAVTGLTATADSLPELVFWRALAGIGLGGEWAAGSVLVAETWPAAHRGKAIGLMQSAWAIGYMLAAVLAAAILPDWGWRPLFVAGLLPAAATLWMRRGWPSRRNGARTRTPSPAPSASLFRPPLRRTVLLVAALCSCVLFGYWGLFTWLPAYLSTPVARGGAGLTVLQSSGWIIPLQVGAFFGYISFGFWPTASDAARRSSPSCWPPRCWCRCTDCSAASTALLLALGPLIGFFGHGYFSVMGAMMAELFPAEYPRHRAGLLLQHRPRAGGPAPVTVGALADHFGIGAALGVTSMFFAAGAGVMLLLPETRGRELR